MNSNQEKIAVFNIFSKFSYELKLKEIFSVFYTAYAFFSCEFKPGKIAVFDVFSKFRCELKLKEILSVFYTVCM